MGSNETTATTGAAGAAFGGLAAWGLGLALGVEIPTEQAVGCSILGSFVFGRIFGR